MIIAVNFPIEAIGKKKPEKKKKIRASTGFEPMTCDDLTHDLTAMIILYFHLQPQFKYELFHIYFTSVKITVAEILK